MMLGYTRVLVEVNVNSEFPKEIELNVCGCVGVEKQTTFAVEYPWIPTKRSICQVMHV